MIGVWWNQFSVDASHLCKHLSKFLCSVEERLVHNMLSSHILTIYWTHLLPLNRQPACKWNDHPANSLNSMVERANQEMHSVASPIWSAQSPSNRWLTWPSIFVFFHGCLLMFFPQEQIQVSCVENTLTHSTPISQAFCRDIFYLCGLSFSRAFVYIIFQSFRTENAQLLQTLA